LNGKDEELTSILSKYHFLVNWRNKSDKTLLHFAIGGNHLSTCKILLDFGADMFFDGRVKIYSNILLFCI